MLGKFLDPKRKCVRVFNVNKYEIKSSNILVCIYISYYLILLTFTSKVAMLSKAQVVGVFTFFHYNAYAFWAAIRDYLAIEIKCWILPFRAGPAAPDCSVGRNSTVVLKISQHITSLVG